MLRIKDNNIYLTKGDTAYLNLVLVGKIGDKTFEYQIDEADKLIFGMKKNVYDEEFIIEKEIKATDYFKFKSSDTDDLKPGKYYYEVKLINKREEVFTVIPLSCFYLERGIN